MSLTADFAPGNYRYVRGPFQYSGGVRAEQGFEIVRVRFRTPPPVARGFAAIEAHLNARERPLTAFCACELRSPGQFTDEGFRAFNRDYVGTLSKWGIVHGDDNPVARSNVCPEVGAPTEPVFEAFCYTRPWEGRDGAAGAPSFVIAGSGEASEGGQRYEDRIVRLGDTSLDGLRDKVRFVLDEMERRMSALEVSWAASTVTQMYTVFDVQPLIASEIVERGAATHGLVWYHARPPVVGLDFEMDVRGLSNELVIGE